MKRLLSVSAFVAVLAACSGNNTGGTGGGSGGSGGSGTGGSGGSGTGGGSGGGTVTAVQLDTWCSRLADAVCAREQRCSQIDQANVSLCRAQALDDCLNNLGAVDAGIASFDSAKAGSCIADFATFTCTKGNGTRPASCTGVVAPRGTSGGPCVTSTSVGSAFISDSCATGFCSGTNSCGTCVSYVNIAQPCNGGTARCEPATSWCPADDGGARQCQGKRASGDACGTTTSIFGGTFGNDIECTDECVRRNDGGYRCGYLALGEQCRETNACGPDAFCKDIHFSGCILFGGCTLQRPGICTARVAMGGACTNEQSDDGCQGGGTCLEGTCKVPPFYTRTSGQECDTVTQCAENFFCNGLTIYGTDGGRQGACATRIMAGSGCGSLVRLDDPCEQGARCPTNGPNCLPLLSAGGVCNTLAASPAYCKSLLDCFHADAGTAGVCRVPADAGQQCGATGFGVTCRSESFSSNFCARDGGTNLSSGVCAAPLPNGSPCVANDNCQSLRCFSSVCTAKCF